MLEAARALGYVYNRRAAGLRSQRSGLIAIAINDLESPYFSEVVAGAQAEIEKCGHMAVISNSSEDPKRQSNFLRTVREYSVDGVLICPAVGLTSDVVEEALSWARGVVVFSRHVPGMTAEFVGGDNYGGMRLLMTHLTGLGHKRIAHIGCNPSISPSRDRIRAYRRGLKEAGIALDPSLEVTCPATRKDGFDQTLRMLSHQLDVTALTCFNDTLAFGAMLALHSLGIQPGAEVSVTGFDNVPEASVWLPGLTTVDVPRKALGQLAAERLFAQLKGQSSRTSPPRSAAQLMLRGSTGAASARVVLGRQ